MPLLIDCLNRMHRSFGVAVNPPSATAVTFLIDPLRVLRFQIEHDLALWDLDGLRGLLRMKRHSAVGVTSRGSRDYDRGPGVG